MGVNNLHAAAILLAIVAPVAIAEELCTYMQEIPRPEPPDFPEIPPGSTWSNRPLLPPEIPWRPEICVGQPVVQGSIVQQEVFMEEEIEGEVVIAKLNVNGDETPILQSNFIVGTFVLLSPVLRKIDDQWFLIITQRQDYETPGMQLFRFIINVGPAQAIITINVVNIDDNDPIIYALDPCHIPELGEARLTDCIYEVTDIDGEISTRFMEFYVISDRGDEEIFYITGEVSPSDFTRMDMLVGIRRPLNFIDNQLHIFTVRAVDSGLNNASVTMVVQVQNVDHRPPRWVEILPMHRFKEKTVQQFSLRAVDSDIDIRNPIEYRLIRDEEETFFSLETVEGGHDGAILHVDRIDRDLLEKEVFQVTIVAYKANNESLYVDQEIVIVVDDINDKRPKPLREDRTYRIEIPEETPVSLNLDNFGFHDRDLGEHARYTVEIVEAEPPDAKTAFYVSPQEGYQRQAFFVGTQRHEVLDYEDDKFQNIKLTVMATDMNNTDFIENAYIFINLINWNDEVPIFEQSSYTFSFKETVGEGFYVGTVRAWDRDYYDRVEHSLMGNAVDYLRIDKDTGEIFVSRDNAFDFHRQNVLFIQVRADDTLGEPYHTTTTQVVIELENVNISPPTLRLPRVSPEVEENVPAGIEVVNTIGATDLDLTAHLQFEINWDESWATKQGRATPRDEFLECVEIKTVFDNEDQKGSATGVILVKEIRDGVTIDFEEFEVLHLAIIVRDLNTVPGGSSTDEAIFTINIIDMNDNKPLFSQGTLDQTYRVREMSPVGTVIGSVLATDIDGPLYNQIHYTIQPEEDTPEGLVAIDPSSGQITVALEAIDADVPPRQSLHYTVLASDKCILDIQDCPPDTTYWVEPLKIGVEIIDTNNKIPKAETDSYETVLEVWENETSGYEIVQLVASDLDRDEMYHTVRFQINYAYNNELHKFFVVDQFTGQVSVQYTTDEVLDRDRGDPEHTIFFNLIDNFNTEGDGRRNQAETSIRIVLLDVNDNAPQLPEGLAWSVSESLTANTEIDYEIFAPDIDEPGTDNSRVGYEVLDQEITDRDIPVSVMFSTVLIEDPEGNRANLQTLQDLRGFWGTYRIHIMAFDHGNPPLNETAWYPLVIRPYNYHDPVFVFPAQGTTIRLATERATTNGVLVTSDGNVLDRIHATDEDGLDAGRVTFTVVGNAEAAEHFYVDNDGGAANLGTLILLKIPENIMEFQMTIRATDLGTEPGPRSAESTIRVLFVPTLGDPIFRTRTIEVPFTEGVTGLEQSHVLPLAEDPKNYGCTDDCRNIYYRIVGGNTEGYFALDPVSNRLSVQRALVRGEGRLSLIVAASNVQDASGVPHDDSTLTVTVNVIEEDPKPVFERELYTAGISVFDIVQKELLTVTATHSLNAVIEYTIDWASMQVDPSLEAVRNSAFVLDAASGLLRLNMQPLASMHGMFEFDIKATDTDGGQDTTHVKIYLVSDRNRVYFRFMNTVAAVESNTDFIADTFTSVYRMTCNVDQVVQGTDASGAALAGIADVLAHFIDDDVPVPAEEIEPLRNNARLLAQLRETLVQRELELQDLITGASGDELRDPNVLAVYVLGALAAFLSLLCFVLLFTCIFRTRALNRRLEALSTTRYGSVDSGKVRAHIAPNTNIHATEGSNPIYNVNMRHPDFDALSDISDTSDLVGVEDMRHFNDARNSSLDGSHGRSSQQEQDDAIATHGNAFRFKTVPYGRFYDNYEG